MKKIIQIFIGVMIIIMFGMNIEQMENLVSNSYGGPISPLARDPQAIEIANKEADATIISMMPITCLPSNKAESLLVSKGLSILATGAVVDKGQGDELVEIWMHPKEQWFVILRLIPSKNMSCVVSKGPVLMPGGTLFEQESAL